MFGVRVFKILGSKRLYNLPLLQNCTNSFNFNRYRHKSALNVAWNNQNCQKDKLRPNFNEPLSSNTSTQSVNTNVSEQEFLIRLKNDPDLFGGPPEKELYDEGDVEEAKYLEEQPLPSKKMSTKQYADIIQAFIKKRQIKEAIDFVEVKMVKEDRVKPENYIYNLLLGACGRVGYTKKAFSLYNEMKRRGLKVTPSTYTALFNACANSPWPTTDGLTRAKHLHNIMIEKMYEPNDTNYNAMIKAFGRCGDMTTAFSLVDEMASKRLVIKEDTINFLLQACISDKEAGFRHALLVWRKLINKNISPNIYTFNLMLRSIRDCGMGDVEVMNEALSKILEQKTLHVEENNVKLITDDSDTNQENSIAVLNPTDSLTTLDDKSRPNLMAKVPHLGNIISLLEIKKPEDRLLLVGGLKGFLRNMEESNCCPDIKTFSQLLDCIPSSLAAEKELLNVMKKFNIKPDVDFYNMLIKKRSMRFDYRSAKDAVIHMEELGFRPNVITYGVLSLGCKTREEALELIEEMKSHSYRLNAEILGAMLHQACYQKAFPYVLEIMEMALREDVKPNKKFMECLANFKKQCKEILNDPNNPLGQRKNFNKGFKIFVMRYKTWLEEVQTDESEDVHPWSQFRQETTTDVSKYKDKTTRFKPRRASLFRVKTSTKKK